MAVSDVQTWGLLNRWPIILQESSWHYNQIAGTGAPLTGQCDSVYISDDRNMIADALNLAVEMVAEQLGFYPRPTWIVERAVGFNHHNWMSLQTLKTRYGYLQEFGVRTTSLIQAGASVVYSDTNSDGVDDTATITVTTSIDTDEICLFFRTADGAPSDGHQYWEIRPLISVTASAGVVTIKAPRWLFVKPNRVWAKPYVEPNFTVKFAADTQQPADFVTLVDIYRVYSDATAAVQITGDPIYSQCSDLDTAITSNGEAYIVDSRLGRFRSRLTCGSCFNSYPESVYIAYKAGLPLVNGKMDRRLETAIIRLANTLMPYQPSSWCDKTLGMWQFDRNTVDPATLTQADLHPFGGLMVGRVEAWRNLRGMALGRGGKVTV